MHRVSNGSTDGGGFLSRGPVAGAQRLITPDRVALWWFLLDKIGPSDWILLEDLLSDAERERSGRFHFERDRQVYVAAHASCRGLLSYCLGGPPQSWTFTVTEHGKPELLTLPGQPRYRVNISHTRGLAAVTLTQVHDVGVDVEWLRRSTPVDQLAKRMFAESERRLVEAANEADKQRVFLSVWTLKEAYVKAIGKGLSQPLDAFAFDLDSDQITFTDRLAESPENWHFERYQIDPDHLMALAVRHPNKSGLVVDVKPTPLSFLLGLTGADFRLCEKARAKTAS